MDRQLLWIKSYDSIIIDDKKIKEREVPGMGFEPMTFGFLWSEGWFLLYSL